MDPAKFRPSPDRLPVPLNLLRRDRDAIELRMKYHAKGCMPCLQFIGGFRKERCSLGQDIHRQWNTLDEAVARREME